MHDFFGVGVGVGGRYIEHKMCSFSVQLPSEAFHVTFRSIMSTIVDVPHR